jgi:K+-transporting ATPase ATPase C chain
MKKFFQSTLTSAFIACIFFTLLFGIAYPYLIHLLGASMFPKQTYGSLLYDKKGDIIGSSLIGQKFSDPSYFYPRISFAGPLGYDAAASQASFFGPTSSKYINILTSLCTEYRETNNVSQKIEIPADAVMSSASGLDPHISVANALLQSARISKQRNIPLSTIDELIEKNKIQSFFGTIDYINVLKINLELDLIKPQSPSSQ